ncbi:MAG: DUF4115 domain-containing protein [Peptococcaceae bacterium]
MEIGHVLKRTRVEKNLSLAQAEEETKIRQKYLVALENENYDVIPGRVYAKGFLRNYARYLGLNAEEIIYYYEKQYPTKEGSSEQVLTPEVRPDNGSLVLPQRKITKKKKRTVPAVTRTVTLITFGLFLILGFIWLAHIEINKMDNTKFQPVSNQHQKLPEKNLPAPPNDSLGEQKDNAGMLKEGVNLVLHVTDDRCWAEVIVDGQVKFTGELAANQIKTFHGQENVRVKLGNAGVVQVKINGRDLGFLGARGEVIKWEYPDSFIS